MSKRDWIEVAAATVAGTGIGAALMYLFDPEVGEKRRAKAAALAGDYASSAGEALGTGWEHVSDGAQHIAGKARDYAGSIGETASDHAHAAAKYAGKLWSRGTSGASDYVDDKHDQIRGWGRDASKRVSKALGREQHSAVGLTVGVVGALALGAGVMFLLDPAQGRRRRAIIKDRATGFAGSTADYARSAGRTIADKTTDLAGSARDYAGKAVTAVKGAVGANGATPAEQTPSTTTQSA